MRFHGVFPIPSELPMSDASTLKSSHKKHYRGAGLGLREAAIRLSPYYAVWATSRWRMTSRPSRWWRTTPREEPISRGAGRISLGANSPCSSRSLTRIRFQSWCVPSLARALALALPAHIHRRALWQTVRNQLANKLGVTPRCIQVWFQNRRQKWKAIQKTRGVNPPALKSVSSRLESLDQLFPGFMSSVRAAAI